MRDALSAVTRNAVCLLLAAFLLLPGTGLLEAQQRGEEVERGVLPDLKPLPVLEPDPIPAPPAAVQAPASQGTSPAATADRSAEAGKQDRTGTPAATVPVEDPDETTAPQIWRPNPALARPDLTAREPIKIFVGTDYPPFNYTDASGTLTGYNVDLARAVCLILRTRCTITAIAWDDLVPGLLNGSADALVAGMKITPDALGNVDFTQPYFRTPARFAVRSDGAITATEGTSLSGKRIGVVRDSAHAAYLSAFFPQSIIRLYASDTQAMDALRGGEVDATFGDGTALMFWTLGPSARGCCRLAEGAYIEPSYFGGGAGIAVRRGDTPLRDGFQFALDRLQANGTYDALTRRYFPATIY